MPRCTVFTAVVPGEEIDPANSTAAIAGALLETLQELGWSADHRKFDGDLKPLLEDLRADPPDFVFNLVESFLATDRLAFMATGVYEAAQVPFAGSGTFGLMAGTDKLIAKRLLDANGIATPAYATAPVWQGLEDGRRYIVKAIAEHASLGLDEGAVCTGREAVFARAAAYEAKYGAKVFAEQYVEGREFNVGVVDTATGPRVLPLAEMDFSGFPDDRPRIIDYAAKWNETSFEYRHTNRRFIDEVEERELADRLKATALMVWDIFDLGGWARVDFRVDATTGEAYVIDVNVNPDISHDAGLAAAAKQAGISYRALIAGIVDAGRRRART